MPGDILPILKRQKTGTDSRGFFLYLIWRQRTLGRSRGNEQGRLSWKGIDYPSIHHGSQLYFSLDFNWSRSGTLKKLPSDPIYVVECLPRRVTRVYLCHCRSGGDRPAVDLFIRALTYWLPLVTDVTIVVHSQIILFYLASLRSIHLNRRSPIPTLLKILWSRIDSPQRIIPLGKTMIGFTPNWSTMQATAKIVEMCLGCMKFSAKPLASNGERSSWRSKILAENSSIDWRLSFFFYFNQIFK